MAEPLIRFPFSTAIWRQIILLPNFFQLLHGLLHIGFRLGFSRELAVFGDKVGEKGTRLVFLSAVRIGQYLNPEAGQGMIRVVGLRRRAPITLGDVVFAIHQGGQALEGVVSQLLSQFFKLLRLLRLLGFFLIAVCRGAGYGTGGGAGPSAGSCSLASRRSTRTRRRGTDTVPELPSARR